MKSDRRHKDIVFARLLAVMFVLALIPSVALSYAIYRMDRAEHFEQGAVLLNSLSADRELATRLLIERRRDALVFLTRDPVIRRLARGLGDKKYVVKNGFMDDMVSNNMFFEGLSVVNVKSGRYGASGIFPPEMIKRTMEQLAHGNGERPFVRVETLADGQKVFLMGQPIDHGLKGGGVDGVLLGIVRMSLFDELFKDTSMLGETGESFLTDAKGVALTPLRYSSHEIMSHPIDASAMLDCLAGNSKRFVITPDYVGVPTAMSYKPIKSYGGCIMVHMRATEIMEPINAMRDLMIAIVAILLLVAGLIAFLVLRKLMRMNKERNELEDELEDRAGKLEIMAAERAEMNRALERRADELASVNKELEAFSYSVAHDLRAPLRSIDGFAHILTDDFSDKLGDEGMRSIDTIRLNAQKMGRLIDDLLRLAQIGRHEMKLQEIDMNGLVESVIRELEASSRGRVVEFNVKRLLPAKVEPLLMRQVVVNLLSNAVKFTRHARHAVIEVGCEKSGDQITYYVRDNGIGFDPRYQKKLFGVFERLHDGREFEGTGIGLAIVQRIIQRHGGRVRGEGSPDKGATFYFTIPA